MTSTNPPPLDTTSGAPHSPTGNALRAWLRFANLQFSARLANALLTRYAHNPEAVFAATDTELDDISGLQERHRLRLRDLSLAVTDRQWAWIERQGVRLVLQHNPDYPSALREIPDPPPLLFIRGSLLPSDREAVGIVGSRHASPYGRTTAERMARELSSHGVTIVSGGAVGIDTAAHRGAIEGGGRTLAVLGCGLDVDYPRENHALFERMLAQGALISEYPLGAQPESWRFPLRNRLISGLSQGVLVVEAPWQSGALITARYSVDHGRTVMAVPGNIDRPTSAGANQLLKDGAVMVTETEDILRVLGMVAVPARREHQTTLDLEMEGQANVGNMARPNAEALDASGKQTAAPLPEMLPENQRKLLGVLSQTPRHIDAIAQAAEITIAQAGVEMTLLELSGLVRRLPGNTYIRLI